MRLIHPSQIPLTLLIFLQGIRAHTDDDDDDDHDDHGHGHADMTVAWVVVSVISLCIVVCVIASLYDSAACYNRDYSRGGPNKMQAQTAAAGDLPLINIPPSEAGSPQLQYLDPAKEEP